MAKLGKSHSWLVDRNRDDGSTSATAGGVEQDHEATQSQDTPQALNLIRAIPDKASLKVRRKTVAWDDDYLLKAITETAP